MRIAMRCHEVKTNLLLVIDIFEHGNNELLEVSIN